ncbi:MAG TPA: efflux RND transporter periplasmic adaptor subunit [Verrucomicrobiae bacterium]|jgi:membrane fusion protein (multidrug efflux system)
MTKITLTSILLGTLTMSGIVGCEKKPTASAPPPPLVEVTSVTQADVPVFHEWIGTLDGLVNAEIRAQVTGYLITQNYKEGDAVKKGDMLFEIDPRPFQAALDQANGRLKEAQAVLGKTQLDVKRYGPLVKDRAISQEEYDDAVQANLAADAAVTSAKATVEQAELNLGFTKITSPVDGIPAIAKAQIGNLVGPGSGELTTVSTIDPIKVYYNITEEAYNAFAKKSANEEDMYARFRNLPIQLILSDGSVYPLPGKNDAADRSVGSTTGALRLEALFPNPNHTLRPGEFGRVRLKIEEVHNALLVPQLAVSELQGIRQVCVVDDASKAHIVPVQAGERYGEMWVITEGLKPTDRVVVEGLQKVKDGISVIVSNYVAAKPVNLDQ